MKYKILAQTNLDLNLENIKDLKALYEGGESLSKRLWKLNPHDYNDKQEIALKKHKIAEESYFNYFALICNYYPGHLFSYPLVLQQNSRAMNGYYKNFSENCNIIGTDFVDYERNALTCALVGGRQISEICIPDVQAENMQDWENLGGGNLYLKSWEADEIIDWQEDDYGNLEWIKFFKKTIVKTSPYDDAKEKLQWTIIDKNVKKVYELYIQVGAYANADTDVTETYIQEHNLGFVPVIDLWLTPGLHLGKHLKGPALSNMKGRAAQWWTLSKQAYSVPVIKTSKEIPESFDKNGIMVLPADASFDWSNPPSEFIKSLSEWNSDTKDEMLRVGSRLSYQSSGSSYALVRSAQARVEDKSEDHTIMKAYGAIIREHAQSILSMISRIRKEDIKWSVEGFEQLEKLQLPDYVAIADLLARTDFSKLSQLGDTFEQQYKMRITEFAFQDLDEKIKDQIRQEIKQYENKIVSAENKPEIAVEEEDIGQDMS
jgi:hypothetical protein